MAVRTYDLYPLLFPTLLSDLILKILQVIKVTLS